MTLQVRAPVVALTAALVLLALPACAGATDFFVTTTADNGDVTCDATCTLRGALGAANPTANDAIHLPASATPYAVAAGELSVTKTVTIVGAGARSTTISGDGNNRVIRLSGAGPPTLTISGVTITGGGVTGASPTGGGILVSAGTLNLSDAAVTGNQVSGAAAADNASGGGIYVAGSALNLNRVLVAGNTATAGTGPGTVGSGGGVQVSSSAATIVDSTVSGNSASGVLTSQGGGLLVQAGSAVVVKTSTLFDNRAPGSNGRGGNVNQAAGTLSWQSSIIAGGVGSVAENCVINGSVVTQGGNLESTVGQCHLGAGELQATDPKLTALGDHGGPTNTHALSAPSPVVDAGGPCGQATDQRGLGRTGPCDIGAFENQPPVAVAKVLGVAGGSASFDGTGSTDPDQDPLGFAWSFGDGGTGSGPSVSHAFSVGSHTGMLTVSDPAGRTSSATVVATIPAPDVAPRLTSLGLDRATFPAAPSGPSATAAAKKRKRVYGARVSLRLSEAGTVTFTVERRLPGRRVGNRCVRPTRANVRKRACLRYVSQRGSFTRAGSAGLTRFRFTGRLGGAKLALGRYRLIAQARDATGKRSKIARKTFRIIR